MGSLDDSIWKFCYAQRQTNEVTDSMPVFRHPLLLSSSLSLNKEIIHDQQDVSKYDFIDPLGATVEGELEKNLTRLDVDALEDISLKRDHILANTLETNNKEGLIRDVELPNFEPWRHKREQILNVNMESAKSTLSFTSGGPAPAKLFVNSKTRYRLEVLEDMSGLRRLSEASQNEFVSNVNKLRELLITAWQDNKRIEAVRLVTELARLLSAPTTPSFFPLQWVLVTDILDLFGKLVYDRLFSKANEERKAAGYSALLGNFVSADILPSTTEVARNWFCKIADIKEVVPRFYVESTLIGCLRFLDNSALRVNLLRLTKMVEQFPHPLSAAYARAYICKIAMILEPADRGPHWKALNDWMQSSRQPTEFVAPALEWIVQCVSYGATTMEDLGPLWEYCKQPEQRVSLLHPFVVAVSLKYLVNYCMEVCELIVSQKRPAADLEVFLTRLLQSEIPDDVRPRIYRLVWPYLSRFEVDDFMKCCVVWSTFISRYFSIKEFSDLCEHTLNNLRPFSDTNEHFANLAAVVENLVCCGGGDLSMLLRTKSFVSILDYIRDEPYGSRCAKALLTAVVHSFPVASVDNVHVVNQIVEQCSRLCLSIRPDSITDEVRVIERVVSSALDRPFLYKDPERHLAFLIRARSSLYQSDCVIAHIVMLMVSFGFRFFSSQRPKKAAFMRVLIANLFITIPSLNDSVMRFLFSLQTVYLSLLAGSLSQTEALLLFCLETLAEMTVPPLQLLSMFAHFLALLVYVPDIPRKPILSIFDSFVSVVQRRKWNPKQEYLLGDTWILCLHYLWAVSHPDFSVKFASVQSNDVYYGSSEAYRMAVMEKVEFLMQQVLPLVEVQSPAEPTIALGLLEFSVMRLSITGPVVKLVSNLLKRCAKSGQFESRVVHVIENLTKLCETNDELKQALIRMKLLQP